MRTGNNAVLPVTAKDLKEIQ